MAGCVASAADRFRLPDAPQEWDAIITAFLRRHVAASGMKGVVVGLSGGLDSAVVCALAARALGPAQVHALTLPAADSDPQDREHALLAARACGVAVHDVPVADAVAGLRKALQPVARTAPPDAERRVVANLKARSRMAVLHAYAQLNGLLVCGTGNKSELLTGYFTKFGDGGVDLQPIGDLYKGQVRELARHLGVPDPIVAKPPSAGLHPGQTDEGEMGVTYADLDAVLKGIELNQDLGAIATRTGLPSATVERVERMVRGSEHKRHTPLVPKIGARTVGIDWRRAVQWKGP